MRRKMPLVLVGLAMIMSLVSFATADSPKSVTVEATFELMPNSSGATMVYQVDSVILYRGNGFMDGRFWTESESKVMLEGWGWSPVLAKDGSVIYVDSEDLSLKWLQTTGEVKELLPAGSAAGFLQISPDERYLGYAIPADLPPGSTWVGRFGTGIIDLDTGDVIVSRVLNDAFTMPIGWYRDQLLVSEWNRQAVPENEHVLAMDVNGRVSAFASVFPRASTIPGISFDHQWMAYQDRGGDTILIRLNDKSMGIIPDVEFPAWTPQGLTGTVDGRPILVKFAAKP